MNQISVIQVYRKGMKVQDTIWQKYLNRCHLIKPLKQYIWCERAKIKATLASWCIFSFIKKVLGTI